MDERTLPEAIPQRFYREQRDRLIAAYPPGVIEEFEALMKDCLPHPTLGQKTAVLALMGGAYEAGRTREKIERDAAERKQPSPHARVGS